LLPNVVFPLVLIRFCTQMLYFLWFWLVLLFLLLFTAFSSLGCLPPPAGISYSIPMQNWCKTLSWLPFSSCGHFWFNSNSKVMQNPLLVAFLLLWSFLIQFRFRIDGKSNIGCLPPPVLAAFLLLWAFLIQLLFRIDLKSSPSFCGHFLFNSWSKLMQNPLLAAFRLLWSFLIQFLCKIDAKSSLGCLPPPVVIYYPIPIQN